MRMLVSVEFADAGTKTGTHQILVVGGCSDTTAPGDIVSVLRRRRPCLTPCSGVRRRSAAEITEKAVDAVGAALAYQ